MSSEPTYYMLLMSLPAGSNTVTASLVAQFTANVVVAGEFVFIGVNGNSNANALGTLFSFSAPPRAAGAAVAYIPSSTTSLSGTLTPGNALPVSITLDVMDPATGEITNAATLPANTSSAVTISWTASDKVRPRTRNEISSYIHEQYAAHAHA